MKLIRIQAAAAVYDSCEHFQLLFIDFINRNFFLFLGNFQHTFLTTTFVVKVVSIIFELKVLNTK